MTPPDAPIWRTMVRPLVILGIATAASAAATLGWAAIEEPASPVVRAQDGDAAAPTQEPVAATPIANIPNEPVTPATISAAATGSETGPPTATESEPAATPVGAPATSVAAAPTPTPSSTAAVPMPTATPPEPASTARSAVVAADILNLRDQPGLDGEIVGTLAAGERVAVVGGPTTADGLAWYRLEAAGGVGWSAADFLSIDDGQQGFAAPDGGIGGSAGGQPRLADDGRAVHLTVDESAV